MVASLARELSVEEVGQIAYIRLSGVGSVCKYTSNPPTASGLDLLATLERLGQFSQNNTKGLVDIAKDVNRHDLVKKVEEYRKKLPSAAKYLKKKQRSLPGKQRQQLEETYEMMVTTIAVLEHYASLLQRALEEGQDEALEVLRVSGETVQNMGSKLSDVHKKLAHRSPDSSNSSDSDSSSSNIDDPSPKDRAKYRVSNWMSGNEAQVHSFQPCQAPMSQQRKLAHRPRKPQSHHHPFLETVEQSNLTAQLQPLHPPVQCEDDNMPTRGNVDLDDDVTGDSGMGTGSGSALYDNVETWRKAINNPPPASREHTYQSISVDTRNQDPIYEDLQRK